MDNLKIELDESVIICCAGIKYSPCKKDFDVKVTVSGVMSVTSPQYKITGHLEF